MTIIRSLDDLNEFRTAAEEARQRETAAGVVRVMVSLGSCGIAAGALETLTAARQQVAAERLARVRVSQTGCAGLCSYEPVVEVITADGAHVQYGGVTPAVMRRILREHVQGGQVVQDYVIPG